jgi:DNA-binding SARP family transcriptional activator
MSMIVEPVRTPPDAGPDPDAGPRVTGIRLLDGPCVIRDGHRVEVPDGCGRLLVLLALSPGRVDRRCVAGSLWPEVEDLRAAGNLRSALWRLKVAGIDALEGDKCQLGLRSEVSVDVRELQDWGRQTLDDPVPCAPAGGFERCLDAMDMLTGWADDWVIFAREQLRQLLLHALEAAARQLSSLGRHASALNAAMVAVRADPLRESAQRTLLQAHLAEGNRSEARRVYDRYVALLADELGVLPSRALTALVAG